MRQPQATAHSPQQRERARGEKKQQIHHRNGITSVCSRHFYLFTAASFVKCFANEMIWFNARAKSSAQSVNKQWLLSLVIVMPMPNNNMWHIVVDARRAMRVDSVAYTAWTAMSWQEYFGLPQSAPMPTLSTFTLFLGIIIVGGRIDEMNLRIGKE